MATYICKNYKHNTYPYILHFNGSSRRYKKELNFLRSEKFYFSGNVPENCEIISYASGNMNLENTLLYLSGKMNNIPIKFLGRDFFPEKWNNYMKIKGYYDYLKTTKKEYILGLDVSDTYIARPPKEIFEKFIKSKEKVIFNAEGNLFCKVYIKGRRLGRNHLRSYFKESFKPPFCYLNSGVFIGKREYLISLFKEWYELFQEEGLSTKCDQSLLIYGFCNNKFKTTMSMDDKCEYFQCFCLGRGDHHSKYIKIEHIKVKDKKIVNVAYKRKT